MDASGITALKHTVLRLTSSIKGNFTEHGLLLALSRLAAQMALRETTRPQTFYQKASRTPNKMTEHPPSALPTAHHHFSFLLSVFPSITTNTSTAPDPALCPS